MKKPAPDTPAAQTPAQALHNLTLLIEHKASGWDRLAVRDIIAVVYGDTESFVQRHLVALQEMCKVGQAVAARPNPFHYNSDGE
jgi:hypothetical protein